MYCQRESNNFINKIDERAHQRNIQTLATEVFKTKNNLNPSFM